MKQMTTLIVPAAGESSRFPGTLPKYQLTHPKGGPMVAWSIKSVLHNKIQRVVIVGLEQHLRDSDNFNFLKFKASIEEIIDKQVEFVCLPGKTSNQPATVYEGILRAGISGAIEIRDCDSWALSSVPPSSEAFVSVGNLRKHKISDVSSKSFVEESDGLITNIIEKSVISEHFCVGTYGFASAQDFLTSYAATSSLTNDLYISDLVHWLIINNFSYKIHAVDEYEDWGTLDEWIKFKNKFQTVFCDIDGVISFNHSPFGGDQTDWTKIRSIRNNVDFLRKVIDEGKTELILVSSRSENLRKEIEKELTNLGLGSCQLILGLQHSKRIIINDFAQSNPFPSALAINLPRDSDELAQYLWNM